MEVCAEDNLDASLEGQKAEQRLGNNIGYQLGVTGGLFGGHAFRRSCLAASAVGGHAQLW